MSAAREDLAGALAAAPLLEDARCKGRPERFDLDIRSERESRDAKAWPRHRAKSRQRSRRNARKARKHNDTKGRKR
ncbi:hypothetical protein GBP94_16060 [Mycobacterium avium subsp. hominissuis]|nr:hypothetical protein [Mycobacterium avium subsp. hominissuis]MBZ4516312.1 hypothetical protein [Mycobacterium avium subsp. hominissuis]MBZ4545843.1 hypothetical protein [Mycobacterium avium subsp. hominissuis]MBZ4554329.1 hypothetical protein [Mycobacterium avium subsp. hominissuis]MBZ4564214.1 hypothetical protein [Mycobacterium avium subsp. hominissuis]